MIDGLSRDSQARRRLLFEHNGEEVAQNVMESDLDDPVGFIIEMTDPLGKQIAYAILQSQGMKNHEIAELIAANCHDAIPTLKALVPMELVKRTLSHTSTTAIANLSAERISGNRFIVIIGGGGNSYVQVPGRPA